jgi:hypothetical protein
MGTRQPISPALYSPPFLPIRITGPPAIGGPFFQQRRSQWIRRKSETGAPLDPVHGGRAKCRAAYHEPESSARVSNDHSLKD